MGGALIIVGLIGVGVSGRWLWSFRREPTSTTALWGAVIGALLLAIGIWMQAAAG